MTSVDPQRCSSSRVEPYRGNLIYWIRVFLIGVLLSCTSSLIAQSNLPTFPEISSRTAKNLPTVADSEWIKNCQTGCYLGSKSCSSVSCHGSPRRELPLKSAAIYFHERDHHQFAGMVLYEKRSREIVDRLNVPKESKPWELRECLACHAPSANHAVDRSEQKMLVAEGVNCESCHGPARQWLASHHTYEWKSEQVWPAAEKQRIGFRQTKDLLTRANVCADCHVGNADQFVGHDLIAAGHPRLTFEYAAYQSNMPVHWRRADDRARSAVVSEHGSSNRSSYEAKNWLIGQVVNADHELDVLTATINHSKMTRPELSQYDCYACHHELSSPSWRQNRTAWDLKSGELAWGTWNLGLLSELHQSQPHWIGDRLNTSQLAVQKAMRVLTADRNELMPLIANLRDELKVAMTVISNAHLTSSDISLIQAMLLDRAEPLTNQGWDRSVQLYLSSVALEKGARDASGEGNRVLPDHEVIYHQLRDRLSFNQSTKLVPPFNYRESPRLSLEEWRIIRKEFEELKQPVSHANTAVDAIRPASSLNSAFKQHQREFE